MKYPHLLLILILTALLAPNSYGAKLSELTASDGTVADTDEIIINDYSETPVTRRIDASQLRTYMLPAAADITDATATGQAAITAADAAALRNAAGALELPERIGIAKFRKAFGEYTRDTGDRNIMIMGFGDSLASRAAGLFGDVLSAAVPTYSVNPGFDNTGFTITPAMFRAADGGATLVSADYTYTAHGKFELLDASGEAVRYFSSSSFLPRVDKIKIYYAIENGGGSFKIQTSSTSNSTGFEDETGFTAVDANAGGADLSLGIATIEKAEDNYAVKVEHVSGTVRILGVQFLNSTSRSIQTPAFNVGGQNPANSAQASPVIMAGLLADLDPDLIGFMWDDNAAQVEAFADALNGWIEGSGIVPPVVLAYGTGPKENSDATIEAQNLALKAKAAQYGWLFVDGFAAGGGSYAALDALGWGGDGVHLPDEFYDHLSTLMLEQMGVPIEFGQQVGRVYSTASATGASIAPVTSRHLQIRRGTSASPVALNLFTDDTFGNRVTADIQENFQIRDSGGTVFWNLSVNKNITKPAIPQYTEIGAGSGRSLFSHTGNPEGVFLKDGAPGSFALGGNGVAYIKETGTANTGWVPLISASKTPTGTATIDFASLAADASATDTITVTGAATGDTVILQPQQIDGVSLYGHVSAADTVTVTAINHSAGAIDPASTSIRATVIKP